jgi:hypothetical protein
MPINVINAVGEKEPFNEDKLLTSTKRAGVPNDLQKELVSEVKKNLYENIPTSEIYRNVTGFLGKSSPYARAKYSLKQAIMDLGPTGYPFEDFVSEILKKEGYVTQVRQLLTGKCVNHEVDIVARKQDEKVMIEAKFHNSSGTRTDVHVSLYTKARFDDVKEKYSMTHAWIVTNTKVTSDGLAYALCENMRVISWSYPNGGSIRDLVEKYQLHPLTVLTSLSQGQKQQLLQDHVVLVKELLDNPTSLNMLSLNPQQKDQVINEAKNLFSLRN